MIEPVAKVKQVSEKWIPRLKWFKPPKWFIFRWAYKVDVTMTICEYGKDNETTVTQAVMETGTKNRNGRVYSADALRSIMQKQVSHSDNANQVQIGIVNNYYGENKDK